MHIIGLDIGGANIKAASNSGLAVSEVFEIWRDPGALASRLSHILSAFPPADVVALTMTAELADCFTTKAEGVRHVVEATKSAARETPVRVWRTGGGFVPADLAGEFASQVAAANWHVLATWCGRLAPSESALLIDIGSTTTDIIPIQDGIPRACGLTDPDRLLSCELVYTGVRRTPLPAIARAIPFRGSLCPMAAEWFATSLDVYLVLGKIPEDQSDCHTANGRPASSSCAHDRLARLVCCDRIEFTRQDAVEAARYLYQIQRESIVAAINTVAARLPQPPRVVIVSGSGEFLARESVALSDECGPSDIVSLGQKLSSELAESACAHAVAVLAAERP